MFSFLAWEYRFTHEGIRPIKAYYGYILSWDHIKNIRWLEWKDDILYIEHEKGYMKNKIPEKKGLVEELISRYIKG